LQTLDFTEPALVFGLCDAGPQVVAHLAQPRPWGWVRQHRTHACSWMHCVPKAGAQVPMDALRFSEWPRKASQSSLGDVPRQDGNATPNWSRQ
jgi:hypothetical protein